MGSSIGVLIMSHGDFGKAAIESAELIVGKQKNYETLSVFVVDQVDDLKQEMLGKAASLDTQKGLVILTDIIGGTPANLAAYLLAQENTMLVSGINLPILLEVLMNREKTMDELKDIIMNAYAQGVTIKTNKDLEKDEDEDDLL
ncbi:PTS sugar transporter subunit IIA [Enterococcus wangshanyuanii]|uniref:PTS mannose transporter subunit IIAB n=1 Tax=Enterococcus wangshanyuanii TaxID=2005703 RepID=A0ABQ1P3B2_9ENTE|nr:PTS sugar transporter subunit IIA [Enterococcus wangshanyuanii]GGC90147.1 PTS mannose transporter subunit IIAB [Enterococcus wangshanyuanii]